LVAWKAGNLWRYEPVVEDITGLIVGAEYNAQTTISGVPVMVMARVKPIAINYVMFVNPFATKVEKTDQIHSWWYEEIASIDPAQTNSDPPCAYFSVVNELSQQLFSSLTLCIRLSQIFLASVQQCYTTARHQSNLFTVFEHNRLQRSGKW